MRLIPRITTRKLPRRLIRTLIWLPSLLLILFFGVGVGVVEAADGMQGDHCVVERNDYIDHDFYFLCRTLVVQGTIDGDLIGVASKVTIARSGVVLGDIWVAGGQLTIQGEVDDDIHFGGVDLDITADAEKFTNPRLDVTALALSVEISEDTVIPGDLLMIGYQGLVFGDIGGNIDFQGQRLEIQGSVDGNVDAVVGDSREEINLRSIPFLPYSIRLQDYGLYMGTDAQIGGDLNYEAARQANLQRRAIGGSLRYERVLEREDITNVQQPRTFFSILKNYIIEIVKDVISLGLIGILVLQFTPVFMSEPSRVIQKSPLPAVSWGLILFILFFPLTLLSIVLSIVLVILVTFITLSSLTMTTAIFLTILNLIFVAGFWFLLVYLGRAITCFLIGNILVHMVRYYLAKRQHDPDDPPIYIPPIPARYQWITLAVGTVIYGSIVNMPLPSPVPTFELILEAGVALSGLGAIFMYARDVWYVREILGGQQPIRVLRRLGPVLPEDRDMPLGMDNLPEGFEGFSE